MSEDLPFVECPGDGCDGCSVCDRADLDLMAAQSFDAHERNEDVE